MGKDSPSPPPAPDPKATAAAQGAVNKETAIAQANLNHVNTFSPYGNITYTQQGTNSDGTPRWSQTSTLSPTEQQKFNLSQQASIGMGTIANQQLGRLQGSLSTPFQAPNSPTLQTGINSGGAPALAQSGQYLNGQQQRSNVPLQFAGNSYVPQGQIQSGYAATNQIGADSNIQRGIQGAGQIQNQIAGSGNIQGQVAGGGNIQRGIQSAGGIQNHITDAAGLQRGIQGAGAIQDGLDYSKLGTMPTADQFSGDAQRAQEAIMGRQQAQFQRDRQGLESRLAAQGIQVGSKAYSDAMDEINRSHNDASQQAIMQGYNLQNQMFNQGLQGRQQGVSEINNQGQFSNTAQAQRFGQNQQQFNAWNQAQAQEFGQNQAQQQAFNAAQNQQFGQNAQNAQFGNQAQLQQFNQNVNQGQFANAAQQQQFGQNAQQLAAFNAAQGQQFGQNQAQAAFGNTAQQQQFAQAAQRAQLFNDTNAQQAQFGNQAQLQNFTQGMQNAALGNSVVGQNNQTALQGAEFQNNAQNTAFNQGLAQQQSQNAARQQYINEQLASSQFQNQARQQALQEAAMVRNQPLNEIAALMSGNQINVPQFTQTGQVQITPADYAGQVNQNYAAALQNYNQQIQSNNATMGSLFGLGGSLGAAAIMSDMRFKENIQRVGTYRGVYPLYSFNYIGTKSRQVGVMAQEVERMNPSAVVEISGIKHVNYGAL